MGRISVSHDLHREKDRDDGPVNGAHQRDAIVEALRAARGGLDASELGARLGLHPNTIRWHLGTLADAGLVCSEPAHARARGRPRVVFRLTGDGVGHARDDYRLLATMLTDVVAQDPRGTARAYEAGVHWGRDLHQAEPEAGIVELLDRQGFAAEARDDRIEMRRCPFYALAAASPEVVCTLHHGIVDGALSAAGSADAVDRLDPFVEPGLCVAHLRRSVQTGRDA